MNFENCKSVKPEFDNSQFTLAYPDGIENHFWHIARNAIIENEIRRIGKVDPMVLEVGCGRGVVVKHLRGHGVNCWGVEVSDAIPLNGVSEYVQTGLRAQELQTDERDRYNILLLLDVIEHLPAPLCFLKDLAAMFRNVTHFLITIPARQELWSNYDEFYGHYTRYDIEMLEELGKHMGWQVVLASYFFRFLYFPARMLNALDRQRAVQMTAPEGVMVWLHKTISRIAIIEYSLLPKRVPGTSIISCLSRHVNHA
jgi:2-polyprenyl-3-methyl-5-hydroxy-6-metoxy-1,4-benzoquinol methylase